MTPRTQQRFEFLPMCPCGRPLHYNDPQRLKYMEDQVKKLGELILVSTGGKGYLIPRHYIALHGIRAQDLPELAKRYNFREVESGPDEL